MMFQMIGNSIAKWKMGVNAQVLLMMLTFKNYIK